MYSQNHPALKNIVDPIPIVSALPILYRSSSHLFKIHFLKKFERKDELFSDNREAVTEVLFTKKCS